MKKASSNAEALKLLDPIIPDIPPLKEDGIPTQNPK
jgi:hypothetical protein